MAKANVNSASRDELIEAGVRAELADEIVRLRRKGKIALEALDELPGVGPEITGSGLILVRRADGGPARPQAGLDKETAQQRSS